MVWSRFSTLSTPTALDYWGRVLQSNISRSVAGLPAGSPFGSPLSSFIPSVSLI